MSRSLGVWMNGDYVGAWTVSPSGAHQLTYAPEWLEAERGRPLSLSLPFPINVHRGAPVARYFDNLLPDSEAIRDRLRQRFGVRRKAAIALLAEIGRESAGALQLMPPDVAPDGHDRIEAVPMTDDEVEQHLRGVVAPGALTGEQRTDEFRISIAGAQEKSALLFLDGRWHRPIGATPSTHILKLPLGVIGGLRIDMTHSVENEWLCSRIVRALGLPVPASEMVDFGAIRVLSVQRFDRQLVPVPQPHILRLPQEDFCQATGTDKADKYEAEGGPGIDACLQILAGAEDAQRDVVRFLCANFAFWLLAAPDGHAKNFSLFLKRGGRYALTPVYDVLSAWPVVGTGAGTLDYRRITLAMAVRARNAHYRIAEVQARHWKAVADRTGVAGAWEAVVAMATGAQDALDVVARELPTDFPATIWDSVSAGVQRHATRFLQELGRA